MTTFDAEILMGAISALAGVIVFLWRSQVTRNIEDNKKLEDCLGRERALLNDLRRNGKRQN